MKPPGREREASAVRIHPEVEDALRRGAPVVALESAVITSGLPRERLPEKIAAPFREASRQSLGFLEWEFSAPANLELARAMERVVRHAGGVPATIAVIQGELCIGLSEDEFVFLAEDKCAGKASVTDLAHVMATGGTAGTTVSATLAACKFLKALSAQPSALSTQHLALSADAPPFVLATGGIGGAHRGWQSHPDISADLRQIATTPVCVVCSGGKSILDLPATLEMLETLGVPVIGYGTDCFPRFQCAGTSDLRLSKRADDPSTAARVCALHWSSLQLKTGIVLANPPPPEVAMNSQEMESAVAEAEGIAADRGIAGSERTPFLLAEIARRTDGRSLLANLALLLNNANLAANVAREIVAHRRS